MVSCARSNRLRVIDATTYSEIATVPLMGNYPTSLALSPDGSKLYASFLLSGNLTTTLPPDRAPAQPCLRIPRFRRRPTRAGSCPRIIRASPTRCSTMTSPSSMSRRGRSNRISRGPAPCSITSPSIRRTAIFSFSTPRLAISCGSSPPCGGTSSITASPVFPRMLPSGVPRPERGIRLFDSPESCGAESRPRRTDRTCLHGGGRSWITAFGTDRIARVNLSSGVVLERIDLRLPGETSRRMRGPRGLALDGGNARLYVLNKISTPSR